MEFFVTAAGLPLHVSDTGKGGRVLVFLHGYLETMYIWEEFTPLLPDSFRIVTLDLPGHGLSSSRSDVNSMDFCSDVLYDLLHNKLSVNTCILIGHSMGGYIAQALYRNHSDIVEKIIHLGSNPYSDPVSKREARLSEISLIAEGKLPLLSASSIPLMYAESNRRKCDEKIQETIEICETHDPEGIIASLRGMMERPESVELLNNAAIPVSFIIGDCDYYLPSEKVISMSKDLPKALFTIIPGAGHNTFIESPELTRDAVLNIL